MMRAALSLAAVALALAALLVLVWLTQRRFIYFPLAEPVPDPRLAGLQSAREVQVPTEDGLSLGAWFVEPTARGAGWMLILFSGNAGHRAFRAPLARRLAEHGVAVLMLDYRGYGGNAGAPSEAGLLRDARAARDWVARRTSNGLARVGYLGESLGTGVAVALAAETEPDALVLKSPYTSLADLAAHHYPFLPARWLLRDRFPSVDRIGALSCPVLIVAAERDSVVPASHSRRLFDAARPVTRRWFQVPGADHNDMEMLAGEGVIGAVMRFLEDIPPRSGAAR